jgi:sec-independent protein translocase protein TatC
MPEPREDNLFRDSTMTFGEHLGELRSCLIKSLLGLVVGFIIGLLVGRQVVAFIQRPLFKALTTYYQQETVDRVQRELENLSPAEMRTLGQTELEKLKKSGEVLPSSPDELRRHLEGEVKKRMEADVRRRVDQEDLLADEVYYVDPSQILQELKIAYPAQFKNTPPLPDTRSATDTAPKRMIRLFLWHRKADDPRLQSKGLSVFEPFGVYVKASLLVGVLLASPWIFFQIWQFVAAGLYPHERKYVKIYLPFSIGLFLFGAALAFFVVFGPVLDFLLGFSRGMEIGPEPRINEWLSFVWILPLGFGIGFQLPLVMLFLERIGVFTVRNYLAQWRIAVLIIFVIAAVLMPPDPYSMLLNAVALSLLYFGGILLCKFLPRKTSPFG